MDNMWLVFANKTNTIWYTMQYKCGSVISSIKVIETSENQKYSIEYAI